MDNDIHIITDKPYNEHDLAYAVQSLDAINVGPGRWAAKPPEPDGLWSVFTNDGLWSMYEWLEFGEGDGPDEPDILIMPDGWDPSQVAWLEIANGVPTGNVTTYPHEALAWAGQAERIERAPS